MLLCPWPRIRYLPFIKSNTFQPPNLELWSCSVPTQMLLGPHNPPNSLHTSALALTLVYEGQLLFQSTFPYYHPCSSFRFSLCLLLMLC